MEQDAGHCQYYYPDLADATLPDARRFLSIRRLWWKWRRYAWYARVLGPYGFLRRMLVETPQRRSLARAPRGGAETASEGGNLNLEPGEIVEVRSEKEIFATLDSQGKLRGLRFTPEMREYCGRRFKVYKKLKKLIVEATGEMRTIKSPTVLLEGVLCDGKAHGGCDRACFCYWREEWLKRANAKAS
jgi:hypothetical protein